MKIRNKLRLGFSFLFAVVLFFGAASLYYIHQISDSAKIILKNNYETLRYTREMRTILDENPVPLPPGAANAFNLQLTRQEHNITEHGERELTASLRKDFTSLAGSGEDPTALQRHMRHTLRSIEGLNMAAIVTKDVHARVSVNRAILYLSIIGGFTFVILFSFSVNFPDMIAEPLRALQAGIREISHKNYSQHLNFDEHDEFGEVALAFNDMVLRLKDWENSNVAELMSEKMRIETIIEQMQDAIIGFNERQEIIFMNDTARSLLNLTGRFVVGKKAEELIKDHEMLALILKEGDHTKTIKLTSMGRELFFEPESREIIVPGIHTNKGTEDIKVSGHAAGRVFILRNITEFREREEAKTNFIATISHELKTPISSIKMSLRLLKDERIGKINREQEELVAQIKDDSDRLLKITGELLNLAQLETGNIQLSFGNIKPGQVIDYAVNSVRFQAEQKGVELQVSSSGHLPDICADPEKITWVVINLLANALRYSPPGSKIMINTITADNMVQFSVRDFGKGIDASYKERLFDRYFQVPQDQENTSGTGLGLAISKEFIEAHNGKIWVESRLGEGAVFFFTLPAVL